MQFKTILLGTAALALMAGSAAAQGAPKPKKTHHHHATAGSVDARIDELEAELHDLKRQQAAQVQTTAEAPAPSDQQVSAAQFEALQNQVYEQQASNASLAKGSWWSNTKISGRIYYDITNVDASGHDALGNKIKSPQDGFNYDLKRFYLGVDHQFNDMFSANLTTDVTYDSTTKASQIFIKKAFLQAKFGDWLSLRAGASDLPWVPYMEGLYGYRYVENTLIDRTKFGTSSDWGLHALGTLADGLINYQISAVNGAGYKAAPIGGGVNRSKGIDLEGRVGLNWDGFNLGVGGYTGKLGADVQGNTTFHTANRFDAVAAYVMDDLRIGVEYFSANDYKQVASAAGNKADGYSAFASYQFVPQWSVFGRYDWVKPAKETTPGFKNKYYNVGISYSPIKQLDFALVYKHDAMNGGMFSDSEFTAIPGAVRGTYNEIGLFGQVNF